MASRPPPPPPPLHTLPYDQLYLWMRKHSSARIYNFVKDWADTEDVFHDVALAVWLAIRNHTLRTPELLDRYIGRTIKYCCWGLLRKRQSIYRKTDSLPLESDDVPVCSSMERPSHEAMTMLQITIENLLPRLDRRERRVLLSNRTDQQLASDLKTSPHAVAIIRSRAQRRMRDMRDMDEEVSINPQY